MESGDGPGVEEGTGTYVPMGNQEVERPRTVDLGQLPHADQMFESRLNTLNLEQGQRQLSLLRIERISCTSNL